MRVDGPYGEFAEHPEWTHYKTLVIIAGGIGVRAQLSISLGTTVSCLHYCEEVHVMLSRDLA